MQSINSRYCLATLQPCMKGLLDLKTPLEGPEGHEMRVAIAAEARNIGLSIDKAIDLFKDQPDFNPETTRRHVEYIYSQGYYPYSCFTLRDKCSSLISPYCVKCPENG
jgi:DNA primase large subunit